MLFLVPAVLFATLHLQQTPYRTADHYTKTEYMIPMRDGVKLYCVAYIPKDVAGKHPILMERTPYSAGPYGPTVFKGFRGSKKFREAGYIFAFEDVRGKYMSEGDYENIRPELVPGQKVDESTDTWDTVDYLVKNVPDNNGAVGLWGISYPGFYAGAGGINSHPALKAISPQAPVSEWFMGDDVHHNGAFFLQDSFDFSSFFDMPRTGPGPNPGGMRIDHGTDGAYKFFLDVGSDADFGTKKYQNKIPYWDELMQHGTYDDYWKSRALESHMKGVKCAVLTVGGWFDAEDMYGALHLPGAIAAQNPSTPNFMVMGPWYHGMWAGQQGKTFGDLDFGQNTSAYFQDNIEFPFFEKYLRGVDVPAPAKATVFVTGTNKWMTFNQWPPADLWKLSAYLGDDHALVPAKPSNGGPDSYVNDPANPTPYLARPETARRSREYMIDDQRWADARPDVLGYKGTVLSQDVTVAGPVDVDLWVSTTGTDADFVVKVIDVWPADAKESSPRGFDMAGYEQNVRADIMRGKFRNSFEKPEPFVPGQPTRVHFQLNDMFHTFKKGHRMMVQIQSDWFPLVDRNPNKFVDIYHAAPTDYQKATISVFHDSSHASSLTFGVMR